MKTKKGKKEELRKDEKEPIRTEILEIAQFLNMRYGRGKTWLNCSYRTKEYYYGAAEKLLECCPLLASRLVKDPPLSPISDTEIRKHYLGSRFSAVRAACDAQLAADRKAIAPSTEAKS